MFHMNQALAPIVLSCLLIGACSTTQETVSTSGAEAMVGSIVPTGTKINNAQSLTLGNAAITTPVGAQTVDISTTGAASDWPNRPVRIIVSYPPGGPVDVLALPLAEGLQKAWGGNPVIVQHEHTVDGCVCDTAVACKDNACRDVFPRVAREMVHDRYF